MKSRAHGCETCAIVDMMEAAIWLAKSGHPECWEHAERFLRNHLLESQLTDVGWASRGKGEPADEWESTRDVAERSLGGFAGWSQPNDLVSKVMHEWDLYMCCCAQGVRGLFNAWTHAVDHARGEVRVNLLINHLGEHATVRSWLPHEGRIEVTPAQDGAVALRAPSWVDRRLLKAEAGGEALSLDASEPHFVRTTPVTAGQAVEFAFPVRETTARETVLDVEYSVDWLGDTVIGVSPGGQRAPLYRRRRLAGVPLVEKAAPLTRFRL